MTLQAERHREAARKWYRNNKEKGRESCRRYYAENKDMFSEKQKRWSAANPERKKEHYKGWSAENRGSLNERQRRREAQKLRATPPWLTDEQLYELRRRYAFAASWSKTLGIKLHVDHIQPLNGKDRSGLHVPWNTQVLIARDNISKGNRTK